MSQKDKALARAAKILAEYSVALKEAEFDAFKRTIEHPGMNNAYSADHTGGSGDSVDGDGEQSINSANSTISRIAPRHPD